LPSYCARGIHRSIGLFGSDADAFRPERWILTSAGGDEPSLEKLQKMERNNDLIFGSGRHQCLGKSVAMIELNKVFVELLRRFDWTLYDPLHPWKTFCSGIHFQHDMWVVVRRRERRVNNEIVEGAI
jgi:cytochrome P450